MSCNIIEYVRWILYSDHKNEITSRNDDNLHAIAADNLVQVKIMQAQSMLYEPSGACKRMSAISASYSYIDLWIWWEKKDRE